MRSVKLSINKSIGAARLAVMIAIVLQVLGLASCLVTRIRSTAE